MVSYFIAEVINFMSAFKNKSISLYDKNNIDLRKKIVDSTKLQAQGQTQGPPLFKSINLNLMKPPQSSQAREFTDRNMKFKLDQLQLSLQEFLTDLRAVRQENRQLVQLTALMKQNLIYEDLYTRKIEMDQRLQGFSTYIRSIKASTESRYGQVYGECRQLWQRTQELRENVFNIRMRVQRLQQKMGFKEAFHIAH